MISIGYAEQQGEEIRLVRLEDGEPQDDTATPFRGIMVSRSEIDVQILEIPRLPAGEVEGLIRYRLRTTYPGRPDETVFDFRYDSASSRQRVIVFISRRGTVEKLRAAARGTPLLLPYMLIERMARGQRDVRVYFCYREWVEVLTFRAGALSCCTLVRRKPGTPFHLSRAEKDLDGDLRALPVLVIGSKEEIQRVQTEEEARLPGTIRFLDFQGLASAHRKVDGLFQEQRRRHPLSTPKARIVALSILVAALGTLVFFKQVWLAEDNSRKLKETYALLEDQQRRAIALQTEIGSLEADISKVEAGRPIDVYLCLSELSRVLGSDVQISSLQIRDNGFQIEAVGSNPLRLMEAFRENPSFSAAKLNQVVPEAHSGKERFSFSGVFIAR